MVTAGKRETAGKNRIKVNALTYSYSESRGEVFREVGFEVGNGDIVSFLGPNGTGKSTLLKCIAGIIPYKQGSILLDGEEVSGMKPEKAAGKMSYVPQTQVSPFPYPVKEIVLMGRAPHLGLFSSPHAEDIGKAEAAMEMVGISGLSERPCNRISGGEWQLVLIARAITQESGILLLDEPTSHLDLGNQMRILETIVRLSESGFTILVATHFPDHALMTSNRAAILKDGLLSEVLHPEELITENLISHTYGVDVRLIQHEAIGKRRIIVPMLKSGGKK